MAKRAYTTKGDIFFVKIDEKTKRYSQDYNLSGKKLGFQKVKWIILEIPANDITKSLH